MSHSKGRLLLTRELRLRFGDEGVSPSIDAVTPAVLRSWERARQAGLAPTQRALFGTGVSLQGQRRIEYESHALIQAVGFDMTLLRRSLGPRNWVVLCTDPNGTIVRSVGADVAEAPQLKEHLQVGCDLREQSIGTNAPACVLAERVAVSVEGQQHYLDELQHLVCAAGPIHSPFGELVGVLDVTGWQVQPEPDMLQRVMNSVRSIENRMFSKLDDVLLLSVHHDPRFLGTPLEGLVGVRDDGQLVAANAAARAMLGLGAGELRAMPLEALFPDGAAALLRECGGGDAVPRTLAARSGAHLNVRWSVRRGYRPSVPRLAASAPLLDPAVAAAQARAERVALQQVPVLVQGETGVGKEVFARALHERCRPGKPFVAVNCSALPEGLIEAELFGYVDGAFTGARKGGAVGKLAQAQGGTLLLDEVGDMALPLQTRLLRVLQEREFVPVGGNRATVMDVMVLSATHRDLQQAVAEGVFREDLYFRIAGFVVQLPPLRQRSDLRALVEGLLRDIDPQARLSDEVWHAFSAHHWPGNVRQLVQTLKAAVALCSDESRVVQLADLPVPLMAAAARAAAPAAPQDLSLDSAARQAVERALALHGGNISAAARELGVSRTTLYAKLRGASGK